MPESISLKGSQEELSAYLKTFEENGTKKSRASVEWRFLQRPSMPTLLHVLPRSDHELSSYAGVYAAMPIRFKVGAETILAAQSLDTLVDKKFRGSGVFKALTESAYAHYQKQNIQMIYGFPNQNSAHGFFNRLGWTNLDPTPLLVRPLKWSFVLKRLFGKLPTQTKNEDFYFQKTNSFEVLSKFDESFLDALKHLNESFQVGVLRDLDYLHWRYTQHPEFKYHILAKRAPDGKIAAFVVLSTHQKHGGRVAQIMEVAFQKDAQKLATELMRDILKALRKSDFDLVMAWCLSHAVSYKVFKRNYFFSLPEKLRPLELHFGFRSFNKEIFASLSDRRAWYLSYSDSDMN